MRKKSRGLSELPYVFWKNNGGRSKTCFRADMDVLFSLLTKNGSTDYDEKSLLLCSIRA